MNGATALGGHIYQQDFVLFQVLSSEAQRLLIPDTSRCVSEFSIEGRTTQDGPAWDVRLRRENGDIALCECKNTFITRADREIFYKRVRRELGAVANHAQLSIGWATDPAKQRGDVLHHLESTAQLAASGWRPTGRDAPERVDSGETGLQEAMHHLCGDRANAGPRIAEDIALLVLSRMYVERCSAADLSSSVALLANGVFDAGTGEAIREYVCGNLSTRIARYGSVAFTRERLLGVVRTQGIALGATGTLREILVQHSAAHNALTAPQIVWDRLNDRPTKTWTIAERLGREAPEGSFVLTGATGVGKTGTARLLFELKRNGYEPHHVLLLDASAVTEERLCVLPRLACILCGAGPTWVLIDELDRISLDSAPRWRQLISDLRRLPALTLVLCARAEVLASYEWLQHLVSGLPECEVPALTAEQVRSAFREAGLRAPTSESLIACLQNTFLLWAYARIASPEELPLEASGPVTGFHVIRQLWERRVAGASDGLRAGEAQASSVRCKRRAIAYLQQRVVAGEVVMSTMGSDYEADSGIDSLLREGILTQHSTNAVTWSHDWLRQYALVDHIKAGLQPAPGELASRIAELAIDHVRRTAAAGALKWVIMEPEWGPVDAFVTLLHERQPGLASDALPILVEAPDAYLILARLPAPLIIAFIETALQMGASHWHRQISELPDELFVGPDGARLFDVVTRFEMRTGLNE